MLTLRYFRENQHLAPAWALSKVHGATGVIKQGLICRRDVDNEIITFS
ncbi:hypothetical protein [Legionella worsleiensis]|nr:hypothetical protein [Legionella worsleiensis]STY31543.1 Uncharacterised protein [Legionella worsleiensis]